MRTRPRMPQEGADPVRSLGRKNVLELARLLLDLGLILHVQRLREQPFGEAMAPDHVRGTLPPFFGELYDEGAVSDRSPVRPDFLVAAAQDVFMVVRLRPVLLR